MGGRDWTPGPWMVGFYDVNPVSISIEADGAYVALVDGGHEECRHKANANLIAAAPDLYDALDEWLKAYDEDRSRYEAYIMAMKALSKARGDK